MTQLRLSVNGAKEGVLLDLPATSYEVQKACAWFERIGIDPNSVQIAGVNSPVSNLGSYISHANIHDPNDLEKLNTLAGKISQMKNRERLIFSGALDAESINGLDDVLKLTGHLNDYVLLPNIGSDMELGHILVDTGYKNFPESVQPYLDYQAIGAEYYANNGGAYGPGGYVRRKTSLEQAPPKQHVVFTLHLLTQGGPYVMHLPAEDEELEQAKAQIGVESFAEAKIVEVEFGKPYLAEHIPQSCISVEDANDLALCIEEMQQRDGELLKYLSVLSMEQPETFHEAFCLACNLDQYERVSGDAEEYGRAVLRDLGADDELIDTIDGYMDFSGFGNDAMQVDGVVMTEFGSVKRCGPAQSQGFEQRMM